VLKNTFTDLIAKEVDDYPNVGWLSFSTFAERCHLVDGHCRPADIDRLFIAVNFEEVKTDENPDKLLTRYEFLELIVRVAGEKFVKPRKIRNYPDAIEKLITDHILPYYETAPWQDFRDDELW
jgi:NLR family CARD domain-containing protein 3